MGSHHDPPVLPLAAEVLAEVERILQSPEFCQSEQSKRVLHYLVAHSLEDNPELLRERAIGAAVFGLPIGYDTNENPIVRVRANEMRKRLAKYYQHAELSPFRLEIPTGGYRVEFRATLVPAAEVAGAPLADVSGTFARSTGGGPLARKKRYQMPKPAAPTTMIADRMAIRAQTPGRRRSPDGDGVPRAGREKAIELLQGRTAGFGRQRPDGCPRP